MAAPKVKRKGIRFRSRPSMDTKVISVTVDSKGDLWIEWRQDAPNTEVRLFTVLERRTAKALARWISEEI